MTTTLTGVLIRNLDVAWEFTPFRKTTLGFRSNVVVGGANYIIFIFLLTRPCRDYIIYNSIISRCVKTYVFGYGQPWRAEKNSFIFRFACKRQATALSSYSGVLALQRSSWPSDTSSLPQRRQSSRPCFLIWTCTRLRSVIVPLQSSYFPIDCYIITIIIIWSQWIRLTSCTNVRRTPVYDRFRFSVRILTQTRISRTFQRKFYKFLYKLYYYDLRARIRGGSSQRRVRMQWKKYKLIEFAMILNYNNNIVYWEP